jgi:hypothetical protein
LAQAAEQEEKAMKTIAMAALAATSLAAAGCQNTPPSQRNAGIGAAAGAALGAAVSDDDTTGALAGAAIGAAAGYYTGCRQEGGCFIGGEQVADERKYDSAADRYYFVDRRTGNTYWANGDLRTEG